MTVEEIEREETIERMGWDDEEYEIQMAKQQEKKEQWSQSNRAKQYRRFMKKMG